MINKTEAWEGDEPPCHDNKKSKLDQINDRKAMDGKSYLSLMEFPKLHPSQGNNRGYSSASPMPTISTMTQENEKY